VDDFPGESFVCGCHLSGAGRVGADGAPAGGEVVTAVVRGAGVGDGGVRLAAEGGFDGGDAVEEEGSVGGGVGAVPGLVEAEVGAGGVELDVGCDIALGDTGVGEAAEPLGDGEGVVRVGVGEGDGAGLEVVVGGVAEGEGDGAGCAAEGVA